MIKLKVEKDVYLVVDFNDLLTPCEEEVAAYRFAGKSKEAISQILGKSINTVSSQTKKGFQKLGVSGSDNPLAILQTISFLNGWARFASICLIIISTLPTPRLRTQARTKQGSQMASGRKTDFLPLTAII
jgi:DNA-binding CsgD family transcriptional regulator